MKLRREDTKTTFDSSRDISEVRIRKASFSRNSLFFSMESHILTLIIDDNSTKELKVAVGLLSHFALDHLGWAFKGYHTRACVLLNITFVMTLE
jgi:hypothetical protein